jgi:hypothetical protein
MKRLFLLIIAPALLVALGFAQIPTTTSNPDQTSIKGCLGGTDGNYTIAEDNTGLIFKITTSAVDLKPQVGHDIKLTGHKTTAAASSGAADNSLAVTEVNLISEHCAAAAAVPAATVSTSPEAISPPPAAAAASDATVATPAAVPAAPDNSVSTPAAVVAAPDASVNTPAATVTAPAAPVTAPAAPAAAPNATVSTPVAAVPAADATVSPSARAATHVARPSARLRKETATAAAAVTPTPDETVRQPVAAAAAPDATASAPSEIASTPAAVPAKSAKSAWGMSLLISIVVLVLLVGATAPLLSRWRKRRLLQQVGAQNLSLTHTAASDPGNSDTRANRKAA